MDTESIKFKVLVILGPTATGKTDLAIKLAEKFNGELISCDSRQVYKGLDIGTGKLPGGQPSVIKGNGWWEIDEVKIWLYDVVDLKKQYTVADYVKDVNRVIDEISRRGKLPIIAGGTGLYLKALLEGLSNLGIPVDLRLRKELMKFSLDELQKKLQEISLQKWEKMNNSDRQNLRRLVRAVELNKSSSKLDSRLRGNDSLDVLKIGLMAPRRILYERINEQVVEWVKNGIVDEVKRIIREGVTKQRIKNLGLEYVVVVEYLEKKISLDQMIEKMQSKVRQYAKRQITWFKKEKNVSWFDISNKNYVDKVENLVAKWYDIRKYAAKS